MKLLTDALILRTLTSADIAEIARMWRYPNQISTEEAQKVLAKMESRHSKNQAKAIHHLCLGVFEKKDPNKIIGWCGLDGQVSPNETVLFYIIAEEYRCKGYATQCAKELLRYAFEDMQYDIIYSGCAKENIASFRVMEKAGMRHHEVYEDGGLGFYMNKEMFLKSIWLQEESIAHIHGWDFSHIDGRCVEEPLPWDYKSTILRHLTPDTRLLDLDTGGGEFLLSLGHPHNKTSATEGYAPNIALCEETLLPLGIDFKACGDLTSIPFPDESFDMIINRHGDLCACETFRLLKKGGLFITQQVGDENDRDLVRLVLPDAEKPFPNANLSAQRKEFEAAGFHILEGKEGFFPIRFYDVGALVWFARIIQWEFPDFSVNKCFDKLLQLQKRIEKDGHIQGTIHRYLMIAQK